MSKQFAPNQALEATPESFAAFSCCSSGALQLRRYVSIMNQTLLHLCGLLLLLNLSMGSATTFAPKPRHEIVEKSEFIGQIEVTSGKLVEILWEGEPYKCGGVYVGRVIESFRSDAEMIEFYSEDRMRIGQTYLVFLTRGDTSGQDMMSTNSMMMPMLREQAAITTACEATHEGLKAISNVTSEFSSFRMVIRDGESIDEQWIEYSGFASDEKNDIAVVSFEAEKILVETNSATKTLTLDELLEDNMGVESARYPFVLLGKGVMRWADVRSAILVEIEASKHNQSMQSDQPAAGR